MNYARTSLLLLLAHYKFFVVNTIDGIETISGWEYKEDAIDSMNDLKEEFDYNNINEELKIYTRRHIKTLLRDDIDSMRAERIALENKFRLTAKVVKERNVRLEYSHGATKPEKKTMTYNIAYNPLKDYGFFEVYSDCGEYYSEGGLWFKEGEFSLDNIIRKQLDSWGLDTTYLDD